jgi:23S rRNA pseudouridine955/2504/2580 synthase
MSYIMSPKPEPIVQNNTTQNKVAYLNVTAEAGAGQRIDNYLVNKLKGVPKSKIYNILRKGEVRVNKGRIKPNYRLKADDIVRVPPLLTTNTNADNFAISADQVAHFNLDQSIIYEDTNLLILNKPAGLAVHGGSGLKFGLIELLRVLRPQDQNLALVHRIDRDTSGCIILAKTNVMLRAMHALFREGLIQKDYHTLVKGFVAGDFKVDAPLKKFAVLSGERIVRVNEHEGQEALTKFVLLERYNGASLLQASPITGRTHQIRVHAAHRGLPIVGDDKYGNREFNQAMRNAGLKRLYLHARQLVFTCPLSGQMIVAQAPYDASWDAGILNLAKMKGTTTQGIVTNGRRSE